MKRSYTQLRNIRILPAVFLGVLFFGTAAAVQDKPYQKKVVSFVNTVLAPNSYGFTSRHKESMTAAVSSAVTLERFSYAPLPGSVVQEFAEKSGGKKYYTAAGVRPIVEQSLAPSLLSLLDLNKEMLSKENLTEAERNSFLATKAQAAGLSASQLENILNSGFFYIPYVEQYERSSVRGERDKKNDEGKVIGKIQYTEYTVKLKLGLLWYKMNVDRSNTPTIVYIGTAQGWGDDDPIERSEQVDDGVESDGEWIAFSSAVATSAINIGNETKKLREFNLTGGVAEVTAMGIRVSIGTREGVGLDDAYWVEEQEETESGEIKTVERGFVKIREVGDNKRNASAFSYAQTITGSGYSPGLSVREIPQLGINGIVGFGRVPIVISGFRSNFGLPKHDFVMHVTGETKDAYGPTAALQMSLANATGISELWFHLGAAAGFVSVPGNFYIDKYEANGLSTVDTSEIGVNLTGNISIGFVKKYYFRRFGFFLGTAAKLHLTYLSATGNDNTLKDLTYTMMNRQFGFDGRAGLEIFLTPGLSIGAGAEYILAGRNNTWSVTVTDADNNDTKLDEVQGPITSYKGVSWFGWINYSLPSLN